jgi:hypothetical protein
MRKVCVAISGLLLCSVINVKAQIGIGTTTPDPAAVLDLSSTNKGLLIPRVALTGTEDAATISGIPVSMIVYNTAIAGAGAAAVVPGFYYWNGTHWLNFVTYKLQQNINTNGKFLSGDGSNTGIFLSPNGAISGKGLFGSGPDLVEDGPGLKFIWYPKKAAMRIGLVDEDPLWNTSYMGEHSFAFGYDAIAGGNHSVAMGSLANAGGAGSYAIGAHTAASGNGAIAMGSSTIAGGNSSLAFGIGSTAYGEASVSIGNSNEASGNFSTAIGNFVSTSGHEGAFIIGDNSASFWRSSFLPNQMKMHFANGYVLNTTGSTGFSMNGSGTIVSKGDFDAGPALTETGDGSKMIWYPKKAAFRAGYAISPSMDDSQIGKYSVAFGYECYASSDYSTATGYASQAFGGDGSVALGYYTAAHGNGSFAAGNGTIAYGNSSTAIGNATHATGDYSMAIGYLAYSGGEGAIAFGYSTNATGDYSTAMGYSTFANGLYSTATGYGTSASGKSSTAMGSNVYASGDNSTAMGSNVSTDSKEGSFIIGDNSTTTPTVNTLTNQMTMRFANGYQLFTNDAATVGVKVNPGDNSWSVISDVNLKENFAPIDAEDFLSRIGTVPLTTWNYKGQDPQHHRHYGPMAQDFHRAFGTDKFGTIGNNTSINQADFDGVNFTAIQALESRTRKLQNEKQQQEKKINNLENEIESLKKTLLQIQATLESQKD